MGKKSKEVAATDQVEQEEIDTVFDTCEQTVVGDLMGLTLDELRNAQDVWQKLSEDEQDNVIHRVEARVKAAVTTVVRMISAQGFTRVPAKIESITIKDGMKAVLLPLSIGEDRHALIDAQGTTVTIVLANIDRFVDAPHEHKAEPVQRDLALEGLKRVGKGKDAKPGDAEGGEA